MSKYVYRWVLLKQNLFQITILIILPDDRTHRYTSTVSNNYTNNNVVYMLLTDRGVHFFKLFVAVQLLRSPVRHRMTRYTCVCSWFICLASL